MRSSFFLGATAWERKVGPRPTAHGRTCRLYVHAQWFSGKEAPVLPGMGQSGALYHLNRSMGSPDKWTPKESSLKDPIIKNFSTKTSYF